MNGGDDEVSPEKTGVDIDPFFDARRDMPVQVGKRFEILARLGGGGMGQVYKARDRELDEVVALKIISPELADDPAQLERLRREVKLARRISSPRVCRIHDIVELADGSRGVTMQLVHGRTLYRLIKEGIGPDWRRRVRWAADVAEGLVAAHALGIVHRDLKPENIMIDGEDRAVILDFGVAYQRERGAADRLTAEGIILGTLVYMAPEQLSAMPLDGRADLYAVGLILAETFRGEIPFTGSRYEELLRSRVLAPAPYELGAETFGAPPALDAMVRRLLAPLRDDRPSSAFDVMNDLRAIERGDLPQPPPPHEGPDRAAPTPARHGAATAVDGANRRAWLFGAGAALVGALAAGALLFPPKGGSTRGAQAAIASSPPAPQPTAQRQAETASRAAAILDAAPAAVDPAPSTAPRPAHPTALPEPESL